MDTDVGLPTRTPVVLAADDDPGVLQFLGFAFRQWRVPHLLAESGAEAVALFHRHRADVALVLLDVRMPGLDGPAALAAMRALDPAVRCVFMTADPHPYTDADLLALGVAGVLAKPFDPAALRSAVVGAGLPSGPPPPGVDAGRGGRLSVSPRGR
jgi:CheY-like chemotaxis protein